MAVTHDDKISGATDEGYERFYAAAIEAFLAAAKRRLTQEMQSRSFPRLRAGITLDLKYVGLFQEDVIQRIADRAGVELPIVQLLDS